MLKLGNKKKPKILLMALALDPIDNIFVMETHSLRIPNLPM
jgi:hypothetical protein